MTDERLLRLTALRAAEVDNLAPLLNIYELRRVTAIKTRIAAKSVLENDHVALARLIAFACDRRRRDDAGEPAFSNEGEEERDRLATLLVRALEDRHGPLGLDLWSFDILDLGGGEVEFLAHVIAVATIDHVDLPEACEVATRLRLFDLPLSKLQFRRLALDGTLPTPAAP